MKNLFVSYELALLVKELGFDEPCLGLYYGSPLIEEPEFLLESRSGKYSVEKGYIGGVLAPLYQQVFDFFRERYKVHCEISTHTNYQPIYKIYSEDGEINTYYTVDTFEEARIKAIEKAIDFIKDEYL